MFGLDWRRHNVYYLAVCLYFSPSVLYLKTKQFCCKGTNCLLQIDCRAEYNVFIAMSIQLPGRDGRVLHCFSVFFSIYFYLLAWINSLIDWLIEIDRSIDCSVQPALSQENSSRCRSLQHTGWRRGLPDDSSVCFHSPAESHAVWRHHRGPGADKVYVYTAWATWRPSEEPRDRSLHSYTHVWRGQLWSMSLRFQRKIVSTFYLCCWPASEAYSMVTDVSVCQFVCLSVCLDGWCLSSNLFSNRYFSYSFSLIFTKLDTDDLRANTQKTV